MDVSISYEFLPKERSSRSSVVMDHFGIGFEVGRHVIADGLELPIECGDVVCFTGESGSGKSSLMRAVAERFSLDGSVVIDINLLELPDVTLVDAIDLPVEESLSLLSACGLGEAQLLLRRPSELSEGQRYRFRLAFALSRKPDWVLADEFSATLDRVLAKVVSFNVRRLADRLGIGFLLATTHDDILDDLGASLHVRCRLDGEPVFVRGDGDSIEQDSSADGGSSGRKKKGAGEGGDAVLPERFVLPVRPKRIGRTFLGGITGAITSGCRDS